MRRLIATISTYLFGQRTPDPVRIPVYTYDRRRR
jgi:hypothetical protein